MSGSEPRAASGDAATRGRTKTSNIIAAENTLKNCAPQLLPTLAAARAHLLEVIRQRPAPKVETDAQAEARWRRQGRLADVQRALALIPGNAQVALALGVAQSTIARWRAGTRCPTPRLWHRVRALRWVLLASGDRP